MDNALSKTLYNRSLLIEDRTRGIREYLDAEERQLSVFQKDEMSYSRYKVVCAMQTNLKGMENFLSSFKKTLAQDKPTSKKSAYELQLEKYKDAVNVKCGYFCKSGSEITCACGMDMTFCSMRCAYATNAPGSTKIVL